MIETIKLTETKKNEERGRIIKSTPLREIPEKPKNLEMDRTYNKIRK
jgi:hypothetical protein